MVEWDEELKFIIVIKIDINEGDEVEVHKSNHWIIRYY